MATVAEPALVTAVVTFMIPPMIIVFFGISAVFAGTIEPTTPPSTAKLRIEWNETSTPAEVGV